MRVKDKVAIVTGGGSGIGEAIGKELASLGAQVVLSDISQDSAQRVADEIVAAGELPLPGGRSATRSRNVLSGARGNRSKVPGHSR